MKNVDMPFSSSQQLIKCWENTYNIIIVPICQTIHILSKVHYTVIKTDHVLGNKEFPHKFHQLEIIKAVISDILGPSTSPK